MVLLHISSLEWRAVTRAPTTFLLFSRLILTNNMIEEYSSGSNLYMYQQYGTI